ncbi:MAG: aldehyde dehydrogenase family protein [Myxococcales bacterium]|nr:aldehyde dehydrogenase family protein [Myxococcales bacterium]MCB9715353.1 aldehyde dehydrogenase family protein [Myxococcales bacterium]
MKSASVAEIFQSMDYGPAPESDGPAREWLARHDGKLGLFIDGKWHEPDTGRHFDSIDPATGSVLAQVAQAGEASVDAAVKAARRAQPAWEALGGHGRARYLYALARLVQRHSRLLATLESLDNGKPIRETRDIDVPLVARHFYHHAGWAQLMHSELRGMVPVGVVGQVIPWNFPLLMLAWKVAPALAAGNTIVLKPAEFTSLTALLFAELAAQAGLPPGVLNVITGDGSTGALIVAHDDVDKIAFTGSTEVGRIIRKATAGRAKHLTLELGGKSPFIVFNDADLDSAVEGVVDAIWFNQGQVCCAGSRLLMQEDVAEALIAKLRTRMEALRVGRPLDKCIDIGAIVAPVQLERIDTLVKLGVDEGATLHQPTWACPTEGSFYPPTLLTDVHPAATLAQEEIFGPVLVAMTFRTPDEAVEIANNTRYGLAASVWTENINLALDVAPRLAAGVVWVNSTNVFDAACGFGGYRESGFGREGGIEGMYAYLEPAFTKDLPPHEDPPPLPAPIDPPQTEGLRAIDRTAKLYVGGKQARPDGGYSRPVLGPDGGLVGEVGEGNRKDVRNAVEAATKALGWGSVAAHTKAQILYYVAENLEARAAELSRRLVEMTGVSRAQADRELMATISRLFSYGAWADKFEGRVHSPPGRNVTIAMHEPMGVIGISCPDDAPLLSFVSLVAPAIATGNTVVVIPSERHPLAATDLYQVFDTSDLPGGVINIVTGEREGLTKVLAAHDRVDAYWYVGPKSGSKLVEELSVGNMKRTWVNNGRRRNWFDLEQGEGREFLRQAVQVKNIWVPYGE